MNSNYKLTPKKLTDYCNGLTCQTDCEYNHLCYSVFGLGRPDLAYKEDKKSEDYKKLKALVDMINSGIPNDINKINELRKKI